MIEKLNNNEGVKRSETTAGQRELLREYRNKTNELIDAVNELQDTLWSGPEDDICEDCAFDALLDSLDDLNDGQLQSVRSAVNMILDERSQEDMAAGEDDLDDGYCEQCNDYHDAGSDDVVLLLSEEDGLIYDFANYCHDHPELRFGQAIVNFAGFHKATVEDKDGKQCDLWQWDGPAKEVA